MKTRNTIWPSIFVCIVFCVCGFRLFWITHLYAVNIFIGDQWDVNVPTLFSPRSLWGIFSWQHGPHRQGLGGLLSLAIDPLFGWNAKAQGFVAAFLIAVAAALALWLKYRITGKFQAADGIIPLAFFTPVQYEQTVGVTNYAHGPVPLILLIAFCVALGERSFWKYPALGAINFLCIYTGFGFFLGFLAPFAIAFEGWNEKDARRRLAFRITVGFCIVSLLSFFTIGYTRASGVECLSGSRAHVLDLFLFSGFMFANAVGLKATRTLVPAVLVGGVLMLAVLVIFGYAVRRKQVVPATLIGFTLLFCAGTAYGRTCLGLAAAQGSRYVTYLLPAFIGSYLVALSMKNISARNGILVGLISVAVMSSARINRWDHAAMAELRRQRTEWKACYLSHHDIDSCDRVASTGIYYPGQPARTHLSEKLAFLQRRHLNLFE